VEIWVIEAPRPVPPPMLNDDAPGCGSLIALMPHGSREVPLPLKHTDVRASVAGYLATVDVRQQFVNPFAEKIEATYLFPLPHDAAVSDFVMTIGARQIRGIIRERQEAQAIYNEAKRQGFVASLLTQERPNIFTQKVANIEPGHQIDVTITYFQTLSFDEGWFTFEFPMVVGPRFNPPWAATGVGAVGYGARGMSGQPTEVSYLRPGTRSGHDVSLNLRIDAGMPIEQVLSPTHAVAATREGPNVANVALSALDAVPNRDFVVRFKPTVDNTRSALFTHVDARGGFFTLMLMPPSGFEGARTPMELMLVVDRSGSTEGWPIALEKRAAQVALRNLGADDTFQVFSFADDTTRFADVSLPATPDNVRRATEHVEALRSGGGTMIMNAVRWALYAPHDPHRMRVIAFMTDGFVGNEAEVLGEIQRGIGASRLHSFGIGASPNRWLLESMAQTGRGSVAYIGSNGSYDQAISRFYMRLSRPALTDIAIDWGGLAVSEVYPRQVPDLMVGRPAFITGRFAGPLAGAVRVTGAMAGRPVQMAVPIAPTPEATRSAAIPCAWARKKIADLTLDQAVSNDPAIPAHIRGLALQYNLLSPYTAFLAVDTAIRTAGDHGVSVSVPVPVPEGTRYDTTVSD
jgi:Ca-activated chloride channel family protein